MNPAGSDEGRRMANPWAPWVRSKMENSGQFLCPHRGAWYVERQFDPDLSVMVTVRERCTTERCFADAEPLDGAKFVLEALATLQRRLEIASPIRLVGLRVCSAPR